MSSGKKRVFILIFALFISLLFLYQQNNLLAAVSGGNEPIPCVNGLAGVYPCRDVDYLSDMSLAELGTGQGAKAANLWGWTDPETAKQYVLLGMTDTLAIVDVTDPVNPYQVGHLPNHTITNPQKYRDVKVYEDYAFVIADEFSDHGLQVFDLTQLREVITPGVVFTESAYFDGFGNAHNLFINEDSGYAYVVRTTDPNGPDPCGGAVYMLNVQDPLNPADAGCFAEAYGPASDSMCVIYEGPDEGYHGREICLIASDDNIVVGDVTDKVSPTVLAALTYPDISRAHLAWFTEDQRYFVSADMNDEMMLGSNTRIMIWDAGQLMTPTLMGIYEGPSTASDHNVWVKDNYAYIGNFRAGVRILDLQHIAETTMENVPITEAAYFDIYPDNDNTGHLGGAWAVYPYFENGMIAVSDKEAGLYMLQPHVAAPCESGQAGPYPCDDVDFLAYMSLTDLGTQQGSKAANLWGWTDTVSDSEYVLLGMTDTLAFVDISDPLNPVQVAQLPNETITNPQKYRDVKVYGDYAYVIADQFSNHGMQVFDLTQLRDVITDPVTFTATAHYDGFGDAHNLFIHEETGYAYVVRTTNPDGTNPCDGAVYMLDLQDPLAPEFAGCFAEAYGLASDSMCALYQGPDEAYQGREICLIASDDNIIVGDVTDKNDPLVLANLTYPDISRAHLAWMTEDHRYFVSADMNDEMMLGLNTRIMLWDFSQVMSPTLVGIYEGPSTASDHNVWVKDNYAYIGNFRAGMQILDLRFLDQTTMDQVTVDRAGYLDIYPENDNAGHVGGAWAVYPYFESGVVAVSDREAGLYLTRPQLERETILLPIVGK